MRKSIFLSLFSFFIILGVFTSCKSSLSPLSSNYIKADPQPLELIGGKVPVTINMTFPANWFNKNASLTVIPVLRYEGGEAWGNSYNFQGEKVAGNGQTIYQKSGGNAVIKSEFDYTPEMQSSELYLTFRTKVGNKTVNLPDVKIGDGVLATAALFDVTSEQPAIAPDNFQRIIKEAHDANILFLIQQAELRSSELNKNELIDWKDIITSANAAPNKNVDIEISAYASPDGGLELNEKLAERREVNTGRYLERELKRSRVDVPINARYTAQDWEGFKVLVEKSNIQDKDLILRVLSMYSNSEEREREIKNISVVYSDLASEILPQLRRSRLTANVEIIGKSNDEIISLATANPRALNTEELLFAATLDNSLSWKESIYKKVIDLYPNDPRAYNNIGVIEYQKGNISSAETHFNRANQIKGNLPEANLNLGYIALTNGNVDKAKEYFGNAAGVPELDNAMGFLAIMNGNYVQAKQSLDKTTSNNAALAQIMAKDYSKAESTLNSVSNPNATTYYLKAIIGARTNNLNKVTENLKESITIDSNKAAYALKDVEFAKYITNSQFLNAVLQ